MSAKRQLQLFLIAVFSLAIAGGIYESTFNNFLNDTFHLTANKRGILEFPRELPGFLVVVLAGILCMLSVTRLAVVSTLLMCLGFIGMALYGFKFDSMMIMMILVSAGQHLLMPASASLSLALSNANNRGKRMGQVGSVATLGAIIGGFIVWLGFHHFGTQYKWGFFCAAGIAVIAAIVYSQMHMPDLQQSRSMLVLRKRYNLYYLLEIFAGARKQIFLTFGPWVLIKIYGVEAKQMAFLMMMYSAIGIVFRPIAGMLMDRLGERTVMILDGCFLAFVCIGYGYAEPITGSKDFARVLACMCYVLDNMLFALSDARALYLSRLTRNRQEITSTLAMGVSINHIASMTIPFFAGTLWVVYGYSQVFVAATILAVIQAAIAARVPSKDRRAELEAEATAADEALATAK